MKKVAIVSVLSAAMVMSGCAATQQAASNNSTAKNAGLGALAGAVLGAGISKATGGEKTGRDAAIGAVLGAGVGAYMSRQAKQIEQQMEGTGVEVSQDPTTGNINLIMPGNITFAYNDATLNPSFTGSLNQLATTMLEYNQTTITVAGHTDSTGSDSYNLGLSRQRANSVANYLINRGVPAHRINTVGYGKSSPIASNATEA
ncbi:MAG: OmpA family protein, partial [Moraxella sp.]|nr:OmpA family protein [Moraxella sp.]